MQKLARQIDLQKVAWKGLLDGAFGDYKLPKNMQPYREIYNLFYDFGKRISGKIVKKENGLFVCNLCNGKYRVLIEESNGKIRVRMSRTNYAHCNPSFVKMHITQNHKRQILQMLPPNLLSYFQYLTIKPRFTM